MYPSSDSDSTVKERQEGAVVGKIGTAAQIGHAGA
jgi:hypothetical protein